jgi:hypothetical protein
LDAVDRAGKNELKKGPRPVTGALCIEADFTRSIGASREKDYGTQGPLGVANHTASQAKIACTGVDAPP